MKSMYLQEDLNILSNYLFEKGFEGSTFLITGATGLIGSLCLKAIIEFNRKYENKIKVKAFARNPMKVLDIFKDAMNEKNEIPYIDFFYQDISQPIPETVQCDYMIHTANSTRSNILKNNPVEVMDSIYMGTKQVLEYARQHKVKGIVYLSSMEVFGKVDLEERVDESYLGALDLQNVRSCYPEGKRFAELLCKSYFSEYGIPVKIARLSQTFGAGILRGENRVFAQFARSAIQKKDIVLHTEGKSIGNYCYTADTIRAILLLLISGENGNVYTVVNEETTRTILDMAKMVADKFSDGKSKIVLDIPKENSFGYAPETKLKLSSKKMNDLGWEASVRLEDMYRRMIPDLEG